MGIREVIGARREQIVAIARRHGARNVRVFGSVARGDADERSDVDFLVTFEPGTSLMDHAAMLVELEELLGRTVDVAPESALRPHVRERVMKEAVPL
jgi:predicted nucleotidyltransferase